MRVWMGACLAISVAIRFAQQSCCAEPMAGGKLMDELAMIRSRMLLPNQTPPDPERVDKLRKAIQRDGSWPDVNYSGNSTTGWEPAEHLRRLSTLTQAWYAPSSPLRGDQALASEIGRALDCWLKKDPRRPWWWDAIGAPRVLAPVMLMFSERLTDEQRRKGEEILSRAKLGDKTGQNLVWQAEISAQRGVLQRDAELVRKAFAAIAETIRIGQVVFPYEAIQSDFSFHQHGRLLYNHGYGANFAEDSARLASITAGTSFEFPREKIDLLSACILDGSQWMALDRHTDFGAEGREITRPGQTAEYLGRAAQHMLKLPTGREEEFRALVARIAGKPEPPLIGNKHFPCSDFMVHHRSGWYMSARMYSKRTVNTDDLAGCDEGLLSHYLAEGATCIMRRGDEYQDIFPVWDWQRVPGITVELAAHPPGDPKRGGESAFAGGASDGTFGVGAFELKRGALGARKAWFFFSDVAVCLGANIQCDTDHAVVTTLNQCRLRGPVKVGGVAGVEVVGEGSHARDALWVWHDGIAYLFDAPVRIDLANTSRTGSWKRISGQRAPDPVTEKVFTLSLNHGVRPRGASYAYTVLPLPAAEAPSRLANRAPHSVAENSAKVQAVYHTGDKAFGMVFHEAGRLDWRDWKLSVDRPCILVIRQEPNGWRVAAADPTARAGVLKLEISRPGGREQKVSVKLPAGKDAGSSTLVRLE